MQRIFILLSTLALFAITLPANAASQFAGKWYRVEVIVFSHLTAQGLNSEQWPLVTPTDFTGANIIQLNQPSINNNYKKLPSQSFILKREAALLSKQKGYHVLLHVAWDQIVYSPSKAIPIHIYGGKIPSMQLPYSSETNWALDGTITISVQKYFNVKFNLYFAEPAKILADISGNSYFHNSSNGLIYFHLLQSRRMRSNELDYIDHPLYGVLIKIMKIKQPTTPPVTEPSND